GAEVLVFTESAQKLHPAVRTQSRSLNPIKPDEKSWQFLLSSDLIIVEYGQFFGLLDVLPLLAGGRPCIIFDYHGVTPPEHWGSHSREAIVEGNRQRGLVWYADAAITHSHFTRQELLAPTGFPKDWCYTLPLAVDLKRFFPGNPLMHTAEHLGIGPAALLLFVGRLAPNKRLPILIEALAHLRDLDPPVHLVVVGDREDIYALEKSRCEQRAAALGLEERVHFLGHVGAESLLDIYRSADAFVMPSIHEGFCLPVLEAMACGVPVVAARAGALPETLKGAGLLFNPDDSEDLATRLRQVLLVSRGKETRGQEDKKEERKRYRLAVVGFRYGKDFAGGAETSLRIMAESLHQAGHHVEVLTTCTKAESRWTNQYPEGTVEMDGIAVHRFRIDAHDPSAFQEARRRLALSGIRTEDGLGLKKSSSENLERAFLRNSFHSTRLIEALKKRDGEWDAIITGPYLVGLSYDVAREIPEKTILVPCFHDEMFSRLHVWRQVYGQVAGIWYHSPEEQDFAQTQLGISIPGSVSVGTWLDANKAGDAERGRKVVGTGKRYLLYCGRYLAEKGLPKLLEFAELYAKEHIDRFTFVFMGQGEWTIPEVSWARDLGFVAEKVKRDVMAGADALVHLSPNESLSLSALEAWLQGTPVLADAACDVLAGHVKRSGGGQMVDSYASFATVLDDLWQYPEKWQSVGQKGREYVGRHYGSRKNFTEKLERAIQESRHSLVDRMRRQGLERAAELTIGRFRERFTQILDAVLDRPPRRVQLNLEIQPRRAPREFSGKESTVLVPVHITNRGSHAVVAGGPGKIVLHSRVVDQEGKLVGKEQQVGLPTLLIPGQTAMGVIPVEIPLLPGKYEVIFFYSSLMEKAKNQGGHMQLNVQGGWGDSSETTFASFVSSIQASLLRAHQLQVLPDDFHDVTQGWLASLKAWIKRKILGNFKRAYVDVVSRQQSEFNQQVVAALEELTEYGATLDNMLKVEAELRQSLEKRLKQLEKKLDFPAGEGADHPMKKDFMGERTSLASHSIICLKD
ncbi:MAG TPA: glycosyltransferase, partial [Gemmataceae bacterium]|nr:glycosyltransferase [Gemmataceae bacterium]